MLKIDNKIASIIATLDSDAFYELWDRWQTKKLALNYSVDESLTLDEVRDAFNSVIRFTGKRNCLIFKVFSFNMGIIHASSKAKFIKEMKKVDPK